MEDANGMPHALFFYLLLLPLHDINNVRVLTVPNDPQRSFDTDCTRWSNMYAAGELNILGTGYGHEFKTTTPSELLQWDDTVILDGVLGGAHWATMKWFDKTTKPFDSDIANAFAKSRWLELKCVYMLCNNLTAAKKGTPYYNWAHKYDHIYSAIIDNVNNLTLFAGLDLCLDETTFALNGWGKAGRGLLAIIVGKPGVMRGGQSVTVLETNQICPQACLHWHKLHPKEFLLSGPNEVWMIWIQMCHLFEKNEYIGQEKSFTRILTSRVTTISVETSYLNTHARKALAWPWLVEGIDCPKEFHDCACTNQKQLSTHVPMPLVLNDQSSAWKNTFPGGTSATFNWLPSNLLCHVTLSM